MNLKNKLNQDFFSIIAKTAVKNNTEVYVIGGWVRDLFLNRKSKDVDFVVVGDGISFANSLSETLGGTKVAVFKRFGTAMIKYKGFELEFVGARKESYTHNSRKPEVEPGTLNDDQNRRDFTINALAISLNEHNFGELLDTFDGISDLDSKVIRTPLSQMLLLATTH